MKALEAEGGIFLCVFVEEKNKYMQGLGRYVETKEMRKEE